MLCRPLGTVLDVDLRLAVQKFLNRSDITVFGGYV
jgi:hypothetical protein